MRCDTQAHQIIWFTPCRVSFFLNEYFKTLFILRTFSCSEATLAKLAV